MSRFRLLLLLLLACPAIGWTQMVRGTVTDAGTGIPVKAANITLFTTEGQRLGKVVSDDAGKFEMVLPKGKTVYVTAARIGYETMKSELISASTSELLELNVRMSAMPVPLQGIEVAARRQADPRLQPFLDRASLYKRSGIGHIWTAKELERRHPALVSHILNFWLPPRPAFNCEGVRVFIDDMPVDSGDVDLLVAPDQLEGVEMYSDLDLPPDLLNKSKLSVGTLGDALPPCRTILFWRKPYAELNRIIGPSHVKLWRALAGAALLGALIVLEYSL